MICETLSESIALHAAECLPLAERAAVEQHLCECAACAERHRGLRRVASTLSAAAIPAEAEPTSHEAVRLRLRLAAALEAEKARAWRRRLARWAAAPLAAAVLVFAFHHAADRPPASPGSAHARTAVLPRRSAEVAPPTLAACNRAASVSEEALIAMLDRQSFQREPPPPDASLARLLNGSL